MTPSNRSAADGGDARTVALAIDRMDGLVALAMAIGLYNREPAPLVYDFDRPLVLSV